MAIPESVDMIPVASSNIEAIGYAVDFRRLYVRFGDGAEYSYDSVPRAVYEAFLAAPSKGRFLWDVVRGKGTDSVYAYGRVR